MTNKAGGANGTERVIVRMDDGQVRAYNLKPSSASNVRAAGKVLSSLNSKRTTSRSAVTGHFVSKGTSRRVPSTSAVERNKKAGK